MAQLGEPHRRFTRIRRIERPAQPGQHVQADPRLEGGPHEAQSLQGGVIEQAVATRGAGDWPQQSAQQVVAHDKGFEQLGADDQSILLAVSAQLGIDGLMIEAKPPGEIGQQLRLALDFDNDDGRPLKTKKTSLRSLLIDAGYDDPESGAALARIKESLNRMGNAQIREINHATGWDYRCNLLSSRFNHKTGEIFVAVNPRLTGAVFREQHVKVSLFERNELESEAAKLLHCWLCSNIRLGRSLGNGNGAHIDTLAPHVWGKAAWEEASTKVRSVRRGQLRDALDEISDRTRGLQGGMGWAIDQTSSGLVLVSRPKELPFLEGEHDMRPSEYHDLMSQPPMQEPDLFDPQDWTPD